MASKIDPSPARGMRDVPPDEVALRDHVAGVLLATYRRFGYEHIETPAVESLPLLLGSEGGENAKLIYRILKRGAKLDLAAAGLGEDELADLGLRYDLTVPLVRYYAANHARLPLPFKAIQLGPVWRAERPQKGRWRQFTQVDIDVLGEPSLLAEADLVTATTAALSALGLAGFTVRLNDRRLLARLAQAHGFDEAARGAVFIAIDKVDKVGWDGVRAELLGAGCGAAAVDALLGALRAGDPAALDGGGILDELVRLQAAVSASLGGAADVVCDPTLVRGMGYYTGAIFEIGIDGLPYSIAGGGRYDRMIGRLLGRDVPACGFSIGFERLIMVLGERLADGRLAPPSRPRRVALLVEGDDIAGALARARQLRGELEVSLVAARPAKKRRRQLEELAAHGFDGWASFGAGGSEEPRWFAADGGGSSR